MKSSKNAELEVIRKSDDRPPAVMLSTPIQSYFIPSTALLLLWSLDMYFASIDYQLYSWLSIRTYIQCDIGRESVGA